LNNIYLSRDRRAQKSAGQADAAPRLHALVAESVVVLCGKPLPSRSGVKAITRQRYIGATKMPKKNKLSKSDKKMLTKAGKKALKKASKKPGKGPRVARSNVSVLFAMCR
jgi:hypothetical protein